MQRIVDAILLFLDLNFGGTADADDGDAAGQLGKPLLQLFTIVIGAGFLDLGANLLDVAVNLGLPANAIDDGGVFFLGRDLLRPADHVERHVLGPLHSVRYVHQRLIGPSEWRRVEGEFELH